MSEHTKEPWRMQEGFLTIFALSNGDSGLTTAIANTFAHQVAGGKSESEANARRIVASVNACAGINTETLEKTSVLQSNEKVWAAAVKNAEQRDELLAALKAYQLAGYGNSTDFQLQREAFVLSVAAIAKAEKEQA